jgi:hypothetical protein
MRLLENTWLLVRRPGVFLGPRRYVFVLSHMRSYSSLLCHILGSHPEIAGYAEMHQSHRGNRDLLRLRARVARSLDGDLQGHFVLDKILHNEYAVSRGVIDRAALYPIFLVRTPADSVRSIVQLGRRQPSAHLYSDPVWSASYYVERLQELARLAEKRRGPALFVRAEDVLDTTTTTLGAITSFLGLAQPLRDEYSTFSHTGEVGWGDDSDRISAGRVVRRTERIGPELVEDVLSLASAAYHECCLVLERNCLSAARTRPPAMGT